MKTEEELKEFTKFVDVSYDTITYGIEVIQMTQLFLINKYHSLGHKLELASNDEFIENYEFILNESEINLLKSLSDFWDSECD